MKYRITVELDDPEGAMGDSPPTYDLEAWGRYLDLPSDGTRITNVSVWDPKK